MAEVLQVLEFDDYLCIVTEKAKQDFLSLLLDNGTVTEAQAKQHVAELLLAVKHLHEKGIAHRYQEQYSRTQKPNAVWCVMACVSVCESCASATE